MKQIIIILFLMVSAWSNEFSTAVDDYNKGFYIKALNGFYALAKDGDAKAQYNVGMIYAGGKGVNADIPQAMEWYEKAAQQGNAPAAYNLAQLYHSMQEHNEHAHERAKFWYEKAAEGG